MSKLPILHFNDVYRVSPQKIGKTGETVGVTQFAGLVDELRETWQERSEDGKRDGLVLFSGDLFSPSVESSVTRGSHMVPVMNEIGVDVALAGNHDFDFGYPHLTNLIRDSTYPWILSNIIDSTTGKTPEHLHQFQVIERCGVRIGIIGLVEKEWIATVPSWPAEFKYKDMVETGFELSRLLRDPNGEYRCDFIISLTHARLPNDIKFAKQILALSPSAQDAQPIINEHGADIVLGGHDHLYFVSKGAGKWEGHDNSKDVLGAEDDKGDILALKSGYDFRELSELTLELEDTPEGSIRRKIVKSVTGKHHNIRPDMSSSSRMSEILRKALSSVNSALKVPVCRTTVELDLRSRYIRVDESAAANWFADVIRHSYDEALCAIGRGGSDAVFICAGTLRGDSRYGPGIVTLGDILEVLPFDDPVVVLELDGETIWDVLESALGLWPAQEGRFPVVSGFNIVWDSRRPAGQRVLSVSLSKKSEKHKDDGSPERVVEEEPIPREKEGRKYAVVTRDYMAEGHDGLVALKGKPYLIDHESGSIMSIIVRKYLLGSQFINKLVRSADRAEKLQGLSESTNIAVKEALKERMKRDGSVAGKWKLAIEQVIHRARSQNHYQKNIKVSATEHMSSVDAFDGSAARKGQECSILDHDGADKDLLVISPEVDGRLKDVGRAVI